MKEEGRLLIIFISGGVRSGKSTYAEKIAATYSKEGDKPLFYLAPSPIDDGAEMNGRQLKKYLLLIMYCHDYRLTLLFFLIA